MKPYLITYEFYYNGEQEGFETSVQLLESPHAEEIAGNDFDSLWDLNIKYGCILPLDTWTFKKGRALYLRDSFHGIKEWKNNCKPWKLVISSEETTISMERLMRFDADKVIQYLKERGCPMNF